MAWLVQKIDEREGMDKVVEASYVVEEEGKARLLYLVMFLEEYLDYEEEDWDSDAQKLATRVLGELQEGKVNQVTFEEIQHGVEQLVQEEALDCSLHISNISGDRIDVDRAIADVVERMRERQEEDHGQA